ISIGSGLPFGTAQKPHRRVHRFPSSMKVAVLWFQHSPMFGHCADSHTVWRLSPRASFFSSWKFSPMGARAFSHAGFGSRVFGAISIWIKSGVAMNPLSYDAWGAFGDSRTGRAYSALAKVSQGLHIQQQVFHL